MFNGLLFLRPRLSSSHWPSLDPGTQTGYSLSGNDSRLGEITGVQGLLGPPNLLPPSPQLKKNQGLGCKNPSPCSLVYVRRSRHSHQLGDAV